MADNEYDTGLAIAGVRLGGTDIVAPNVVPVPASAPLLLAGLAGIAAMRRRKA